MGRSVLSRRRTPVLLPLLVVLACGLLGMLLARYFLHPPQVIPVGAQTRAGSQAAVAEGAPEVRTLPVLAASDAGKSNPGSADPSTAEQDRAANAAAAHAGAAANSPGYRVENEQIALVLQRWQAALLSNNAAAIAPSYARQVDRYFLQTGVDRAFVRAYLRGQEARGWHLNAFTLHDISMQHVSANEVDVRFVAGYAATTGFGGRAGSVRTLLKLRPEDGDWKIFYERDFNS